MSKELLKLNIEKAQREINNKKFLTEKSMFRQKYHFMGQTGWINALNGLIYFKGKYHYFFQYVH